MVASNARYITPMIGVRPLNLLVIRCSQKVQYKNDITPSLCVHRVIGRQSDVPLRKNMDPADKSPTIVVEDTAESLDELSDYLDVLSSSARLKIVKFLEKKPRDARAISHEIETSYENTKKHLDKLMGIGVIKKEAGLGSPTSKGIHPVWQYSIVPGGLESIIRNLGLFSNTRVQIIGGEISKRLESVKSTLSQEVLGNVPAVIVLGGPEDGRIFLLRNDTVRVGRIDPERPVDATGDADVELSGAYTAVTRISKPHGKFLAKKNAWYFEDCGSTGGTVLNNARLEPNVPTPVHDGDLLEFAKGAGGARLLLIIPKIHR
jgi:pSer/pThr/pTyr-binding forkhead associated (FHA) protein